MVLKIYQNANSPQGCGLYFAKYSPQPSSNIPHGEFLSTVNLNFVPQRNNSTANIRIQHMYVRSGLRPGLNQVLLKTGPICPALKTILSRCVRLSSEKSACATSATSATSAKVRTEGGSAKRGKGKGESVRSVCGAIQWRMI